jgi:hypothetical protein
MKQTNTTANEQMHWVVGKEYSEVVERKQKCRLHSMLPKETVPGSFFLKST